MKSINPYTQKTLKEFETISDNAIKEAIEKADVAFHQWEQTSFSERAEILSATAKTLKNRKEEIAKIMTSEMGKPIAEAVAEIEKCAWVCEFYAEKTEGFLSDKIIETDASKSYVSYEPLGCVLAVMPWNYPFWQVFRFIAPALMAGNVAILKHASNVPQSALEIEKVLSESGLPQHCFKTLLAKSDQIEKILQNPKVKAATLTGSVGAGSAVAKIAGAEIKPTVLELGGSNPFIVLGDADINTAVEGALLGRYQNNGQSCIAAKRFLVQESAYDEFMKKFLNGVKNFKVGDPMKKDTRIGPMSSAEAAEEMHLKIQESIKLGARLVIGGTHDEALYQPTILENVQPGMPAFDDELFGPCASVTKVKNLEEAILLGNQSDFGLGVSIYTKDVEAVLSHLSKIEDGAVFFNSIVKSDPRLPFGGTKKSGYGRELSEDGIKEFVNKKTVYIA